jgi:hypothetical protein
MQVLIIYESIFGNTHQVAIAITCGIRDAAAGTAVNCVPVSAATPELVAAADLLVVGGPTHARGMTATRTRRDALQGVTRNPPKPGAAGDSPDHDYPFDPDAEGPGLRAWFHAVPRAGKGRRAAAFDTRLGNRLAGGAARGIARRLREHGYSLAAEPEGFVVEGAEGPMRDGELDRAHDWAAILVDAGVTAH